MNLQFNAEIQRLIEVVRSNTPAEIPVYLVGGAVRDLLAGGAVSDLDFVMPSQSLMVWKQLRSIFGAVGFTLDDQRKTARLILNQGKANEQVLDFVNFTGNSLIEDLENRDFTINTLTLDLNDSSQLIDPLNGFEDLTLKRLRCASPNSMGLDPLRILRGVRFISQFGLSMDSETCFQMRAAARNLIKVSGERIRDELIKIINLQKFHKSLELMDELLCLSIIYPELPEIKKIPAYNPHVLPLWKHILKVIEYLEAIIHDDTTFSEYSEIPFFHLVMSELEPFRKEIKILFGSTLQANRSRESLLMLAALYHDVGKIHTQSQSSDGKVHFYNHDNIGADIARTFGNRLMLGHEEVDYLYKVVSQHMRVHHLSKPDVIVTDRILYRYFKSLGSVGIDVAMIGIADLLGAYGNTITEERFQSEIVAVRKILDAWFSRHELVVSPKKLLDGYEIQYEFGISPGPDLGSILTALHEEQAAGNIDDKSSAMNFVRSFLSKGNGGKQVNVS